MLRIQMNQNINILLTNVKTMVVNNWKIWSLLKYWSVHPGRKCNVLIVFDMIADMTSNKKLSPIVTELSIKGRKLIISTVYTIQSYCQVPKDVRVNCTHFLKWKF